MEFKEIINKIIEYTNQRNIEELHNLENKLIEQAVVNFDKKNSQIAISIYGLRKILSKKHIYYNSEFLDTKKQIIKEYELAKKNLDNDFIKHIEFVSELIKDIDKRLGNYVSNVIDDAKIKLASTAYAYGLSISQASELFFADKKQLMSLVGITTMPDEDEDYKSIKDRVYLLELMSKNDKI